MAYQMRTFKKKKAYTVLKPYDQKQKQQIRSI